MLKELKQIIQVSNPEIMELKFGCEVIIQNYIRSVILIENREEKTSLEKNDVELPFFAYYNGEELQRFGRKHIKETLGRPITLADVMIAINKKLAGRKLSFSITAQGVLFSEMLKDNQHLLWNLKKDLDGQTKQTQEFLYKLLK